jgi:MYXO-CTERM domain-containing protein
MALGLLHSVGLLRARPLRAALLVGLGLPLAMLVSQGPVGLREARACAPLGAASGWRTLSFVQHTGEVATDGFMVIAGVVDLPDVELATSIEMVVSDESGAEVPGEVTLLRSEPDASGRRLLAWSASEPLAIGAKLSVKLGTERASPDVDPTQLGTELSLVVVGEPTALSAGTPSFGDWGTFSHGVGEPLVCMPGVAGCGGGLPAPPYDLPSLGYGSVPAGEVRLRSAMTYWQLPPLRGNVAWEAAVVLVGDARGAILPEERPLVFSSADLARGAPTTGLVIFSVEPRDHCIALRVRDLRTGDEAQSEPVCGEPSASKFTTADTSLRSCVQPPNDALAKTWCEMHPGSTLKQCRPGYQGSGGSGGSGGSAGSGDAETRAPNDSTDRGCSVGGSAGSTGSSVLLVLLGLAASLGRRRCARAE